jgi:hypothetical protein
VDGVLESEELRLALLRIESQRDQLDAAFIDLRGMAASVTDEASASAYIARSRVLASRLDALQKQVAAAWRLQIQTQAGE